MSLIQFDCSLIPEPVRLIRETLAPEPLYAVGGLLRDSLAMEYDRQGGLGFAEGQDWDLATPLRPREVMRRLRAAGLTAVPVGIEHGTVAAVIDKIHYEITTFRHDLEYRDGRHPEVRFADSLDEDLQRRDFTINAFAMNLDDGCLIDRYNGLDDLRARRVRTVGDAETRFREDYLRMLRAARFACKLQGALDSEAAQAIRRNSFRISGISSERIRDELMKTLSYERPSSGFVIMHETGLLRYVLPELEMGFDVGQNRFHSDDVAMHTLHAVDAAPQSEVRVRWALLMHDLGKTPAKQYLRRKSDYVFYGHQYISRKWAKRIMRRLRFSNKDIEAVEAIVDNHMYDLKPDLSDGAIRRFVRKVGRDRVAEFLRLRMADRRGNHLNDDGYEKGIFHFVRRLRAIERGDNAFKVTDLKIGGNDLRAMGLAPGPAYSVILDRLLEAVLDDPSLNRRDWLEEQAKRMIESRDYAAPLEP